MTTRTGHIYDIKADGTYEKRLKADVNDFKSDGPLGEQEFGHGPKYLTAERMMLFFEYDHLPERLQEAALPCQKLAEEVANLYWGQNAEAIQGLRYLLLAKDCFVRAKQLGDKSMEKRKEKGNSKAWGKSANPRNRSLSLSYADDLAVDQAEHIDLGWQPPRWMRRERPWTTCEEESDDKA